MEKKMIHYKAIGAIHSPHKSIEGIPIQPVSAGGVKGKIELDVEYTAGLQDLDGFSHIIVLYDFHQAQDYKLKVKPFLEDQFHGVFATRAPKRPNSIGLSVLKLNDIKNNILFVENVDILNGTPVIDIKPYISKFDAVETERIGWLEKHIDRSKTKKSDDRFKDGK